MEADELDVAVAVLEVGDDMPRMQINASQSVNGYKRLFNLQRQHPAPLRFNSGQPEVGVHRRIMPTGVVLAAVPCHHPLECTRDRYLTASQVGLWRQRLLSSRACMARLLSVPRWGRLPASIFSLRMPVLSEQMAVNEPCVSTTGQRRIRACRLAMRCMPVSTQRLRCGLGVPDNVRQSGVGAIGSDDGCIRWKSLLLFNK